jgi:hypothetical protein
LSRVYKVLLDLLVIKTITTFAQRPLIWFSLLALPFALLSVALLVVAFAPWLAGIGGASLPLAGTAVLLGALAMFLVLGGALGELVYSTGEVDMSRFCGLTAATFLERGERAAGESVR